MNKEYNENYYRTNMGCGEDYSNREYWGPRFREIAECIIKEFNPKSFIDVGCAYGYLVEALRDLGVEAYGLDVSEYAISQSREDIREFLYVADIVNGIPEVLRRKYDCASTIEVIEHIKDDYTDAFLDIFCSLSDVLIFSSSPSDIIEKTHVNVQQPEYWCKRFAQRGFFRNLNANSLLLSQDEMIFIKEEKNCKTLVEDYEHHLRLIKETEIKKRDEWLELKINDIKHLEEEIKLREDHIKLLEDEIKQKDRAILELNQEKKKFWDEIQNIKNSKLFRYTKFLRM
ncbi:methyltransferase domain-containing protein [Butyrivibrio sp. JL13D10]|uniref:class I SAM-dependent methyltransferase n=1 Tax=Butyrivibrio sp. JL13D10 TaxID=3236815 RepID=UPI0038B53494